MLFSLSVNTSFEDCENKPLYVLIAIGVLGLSSCTSQKIVATNRGEWTMKLLILDNDRYQVEMLTNWLKTLGYEVHRAYTGERAKIEWEEKQPDLVILDPTLKDVDAMAMCRDMQNKHDALVLVTTDGKDVQEEIECLESGADDYLRKPFFPAQLLARIHALIRRGRSTLEQRPFSVITVGPICVDSLHNQVSINGKTTSLTPTESKLLHLLATASQIVSYVWGYGNDGDTCLIKAHVRHLRQKVEPDPNKPSYILTIPGVGYTLVHQAVEEDQKKEVLHTLRVVSG